MTQTKKSYFLSTEQVDEIVEKYQNSGYECTCVTLAKEYGVTKAAIRQWLIKRGVEVRNDHFKLRRTYELNEDYFRNIDTEEKAYFLGLSYADGCNHEAKNVFQIFLQEEDKEILEKFRLAIQYEKPLRFIDLNTKNQNHKNQFGLVVNSQKFSQILASQGCVSAKSLILEFPSEDVLPQHLVRHFIRGYYDGDGGIYHYTSKITKLKYEKSKPFLQDTVQIGITSAINFLTKLKEYVEKEVGITTSKLMIANKSEITRRFACSNRKAIKILDWMYKDATIYMERKHQKYLFCKQLFNDGKVGKHYRL